MFQVPPRHIDIIVVSLVKEVPRAGYTDGKVEGDIDDGKEGSRIKTKQNKLQLKLEKMKGLTMLPGFVPNRSFAPRCKIRENSVSLPNGVHDVAHINALCGGFP